ncbi:MAG: hypothetical protein H0T47_08375 [Planctomycetaceae bacterium]|nr:hypothetical protein [Planctomycetaceae bacterium]
MDSNIEHQVPDSSRTKENGIWRMTGHLLHRLFMNYLWLGLVVILAAIVAELSVQSPSFMLRAFLELVKTIGIAIFVAAIFTFAAGTSDFMARVSAMLQNIVVNRRFLNNMDESSKRGVIYSILQPTDRQRVIYSNIEDYYRHYIDRTMKVSSTSVRSNYNSLCTAFYDPDDLCIKADYRNWYRLYPTKDGFEDIQVGFYGQHSVITYQGVTVCRPDGRTERFDHSKIATMPKERTENGNEIVKIPISEIGKGAPHLDIELQVTQRGFDHWILIGFQALLPTDGFRFQVECEWPLSIRSDEVFIHGADWHKDPNESFGSSRLSISCQQWIDQGSGVSVLIGVEHEINESHFAEVRRRQRLSPRSLTGVGASPDSDVNQDLSSADAQEATSDSKNALEDVNGQP